MVRSDQNAAPLSFEGRHPRLETSEEAALDQWLPRRLSRGAKGDGRERRAQGDPPEVHPSVHVPVDPERSLQCAAQDRAAPSPAGSFSLTTAWLTRPGAAYPRTSRTHARCP